MGNEGEALELYSRQEAARARSRRQREREADAFMSASVAVDPASIGGEVRLLIEGHTFIVHGRLAKGLRALAAGTIDDAETDTA